ncbi:hypothetical protein [Zavarzinia sp. CC-PAN008]|uniref:hypothetical protein n=1 Tax=Zavarzinia sp. CC-PAN008 TaxID=3243332 RepID=UPI003F7446BF
MLTKADEYPIHQTPEPIAYSGTDPNFYDRFFFNGYDAESGRFFAAAFGVYPHHGIMDGAFCTLIDGVQTSVHASRHFSYERMDTHAGPITIEVVEPLAKIRVKVAPNEHGLSADLLFERRTEPMEEPRFQHRIGTRTLMDLTRLTQHGTWTGWIEVHGKRIEVTPDTFWGTRDRSWGVRPIGPQQIAQNANVLPQFYWLWAPVNFKNAGVLYDVNEYADGVQWHSNGMIAPSPGGEPKRSKAVSQTITYKSGTRHAATAEICFHGWDGGTHVMKLEPMFNFYMLGIGYGHPEWAHGTNKGPATVGTSSLDTRNADETLPHHQHIQAICRATLTAPDGTVETGYGVLEQLVIGVHEPTGLKGVMDMAP